jgi:hypothetical protein
LAHADRRGQENQPHRAFANEPPPLRIGVLSEINGPYGDAAGPVSVTAANLAVAVQTLAAEKHKIDLVTSTATTALTDEACTLTSAHWTSDSCALTADTGRALVESGAKTSCFITADYAFGANRSVSPHARSSDPAVRSTVLHCLRAVSDSGATDATVKIEIMRARRVYDAVFSDGFILADGLMVHDMCPVQANTRAESTSPWDLY